MLRILFLAGLAATSAALAFPNPSISTQASQLQALNVQTIASESCGAPEPGNNCAGVALKDVIVQYGKTASKEQRELVWGAVKGSGSNIVYDWQDFGFSAFVPEPIVQLVKTHGESFGLTVYNNACTEIPWCGEAPC